MAVAAPAAVLEPSARTRRSGTRFPGNLANLFIVSDVTLADADGARCAVGSSARAAAKCERCWTYSENVGTAAGAPGGLRALRGRAGRPRSSDEPGPGAPLPAGSWRRSSCLDQVTKALVDRFMMPPREPHDRGRASSSLTYVQNRGAAFGILSDADLPYQSLLFSVVSLLALLAIALYAWRMPAQQPAAADRRSR